MKTKITILIAIISSLAVSQLSAQAKLGANPTNVNSNVLLELESSDKGLLIPRLTTAERDAAFTNSVPNGLFIYNTTDDCLQVYKDSSGTWNCIDGTADSLTLTGNVLSLSNSSVDLTELLQLAVGSGDGSTSEIQLGDSAIVIKEGSNITLTETGNTITIAASGGGATGAQGPQGPQGPQGIQGLPGSGGTDSQTLTLSGTTLSISGGNSVTLAATGSSSLVQVTETNTGYRLALADAANHGDIGDQAIDLSIQTAASTTRGATGDHSFAAGLETTASGERSVAMGIGATASGTAAFAFGERTQATALTAFATGYQTTASGWGAFSSGQGTEAKGDSSVAMGNMSTASATAAFAMGQQVDALGFASTAFGESTDATGSHSTAMGSFSQASGDYSFAAGNGPTATGESSTALGNGTTASGSGSTALGQSTTASGTQSTAMGYNTTALGWISTAMGYSTTASGTASTAMGFNTTAESYGQTTLGTFSTSKTGSATTIMPSDRLFVIGNGTSDIVRSDALVVLKNGNTTLNGSLTINNPTSTSSYTLPTAKGSAGQVLTMDNATTGTTTWTTVGGGTTTPTLLADSDNDTSIRVEKTADIDQISFTVSGTEHFLMKESRLEVLNTGGSIFIGENAGAMDDLSNRRNIAVGTSALQMNTVGGHNTALGHQALTSNTTGNNNVALGLALAFNTTGSSNIGNGHSALNNNTTGSENVAIGAQTLSQNRAGRRGIAIGTNAQRYANNTNTTWVNTNIAIGFEALQGSLTPANNTGLNNIALGYQALANNTSGFDNVAIGLGALIVNTVGSGNVSNGRSTLNSNISGDNNVANGNRALYSNTTGSYNVANGNNSLYNNITGSNNVASGNQALYFNTSGTANVAIGDGSLLNLTSGIFNVAIGEDSGGGITTGSNNTIIGANVTGLSSTLSNTVIIADGSGNRRIVVDNNGNVGINSTNFTHAHTLTVSGSIGLEGAAAVHPDYVFERYFEGSSDFNTKYTFASLKEVEQFVKTNKHLPGVQSRSDIQKAGSWNLTENIRTNLEKVEELYLHTIEQEKKLEKQNQLIALLLKRVEALEKK